MYRVEPHYVEDARRKAADAVEALHKALINLEAAQCRAAGPPDFCNGDDWLYDKLDDVVAVLSNDQWVGKFQHILRTQWESLVAEAGR